MKTGSIKASMSDIITQKLGAGRLFYQWAVNLGQKLEEIMNEDRNYSSSTKKEQFNFLYQGMNMLYSVCENLFCNLIFCFSVLKTYKL